MNIRSRLARRRRRGATVLEMAIILMMFLVISFGIVDWAWVFFVRHSMYHAARESARAMAVQEQTAEQGATIVNDILSNSFPSYTFGITVQNAPENPDILVDVTIPMSSVELTGFTTSYMTKDLQATVNMVREGL